MTHEAPVEAWFNRRNLTLDLAGLSEAELQQGSMLIGGSGVIHVQPGEQFEYNEVDTVVFNWGDSRAEEVFSIMLEHDDMPAPGLFPFSAAAVIGNELWSLALQDRHFDPALAYPRRGGFVTVPYNAEQGLATLEQMKSKPAPWPELIGKVGFRWVVFEMGIRIR